MHTVLALDTTTAACSVALCHKGEITHRFRLASREHTRLLLPMVDELLAESGIAIQQLDALAFTHGPGSFTGIRIGFGVVQGLAFGADLALAPVSSLETLAHTAVRNLPITDDHYFLVPMFDARMDEVYWANFEWRDGRLTRCCEDSLSAPENLSLDLPNAPLYGVGDGWQYGERIALQPTQVDTTLLPDARDVLTVAMPDIKAGRLRAVDDVQPLYLRDKVSWKKRQRLR
ncbi:MAG: tRNA (adenosine(37)-N6)-threonylcarbamoyltransferase complex dimerization subunit type 1 TsaB, partial [Gammaproteobacteria bacterium]